MALEPEPKRRRGRPPANANEPSWDDAIVEVLRANGAAMHYTAVAEQISLDGIKSVANPAASVATTFSKSLADPDSSPFIRTEKGVYTLKELLSAQSPNDEAEAAEVAEPETGALRAFGMFWERGRVEWSGKPRILGQQSEGAVEVDFADQVGVYLLHDRDRVIYVGRADVTLHSRLKAHTTDRLGGRWDRFSWFGLRAVGEDGTLTDAASDWTHKVVIETMEALLIESMEPPLNRRRGDNFQGAEYQQVTDQDIEDRNLKAAIDELMKKRGR